MSSPRCLDSGRPLLGHLLVLWHPVLNEASLCNTWNHHDSSICCGPLVLAVPKKCHSKIKVLQISSICSICKTYALLHDFSHTASSSDLLVGRVSTCSIVMFLGVRGSMLEDLLLPPGAKMFNKLLQSWKEDLIVPKESQMCFFKFAPFCFAGVEVLFCFTWVVIHLRTSKPPCI